MANTVATIMGILFILIGLTGFIFNNFAGAHLTTAHNIIHLVSGAASLYVGLKVSRTGARLFCIVFGLLYLSLAIGGYWLGFDHRETYLPSSAEDHGYNQNMFHMIPGVLELGTMDHIIHILIAAVYIIAGFLTRTGESVARYIDGDSG